VWPRCVWCLNIHVGIQVSQAVSSGKGKRVQEQKSSDGVHSQEEGGEPAHEAAGVSDGWCQLKMHFVYLPFVGVENGGGVECVIYFTSESFVR